MSNRHSRLIFSACWTGKGFDRSRPEPLIQVGRRRQPPALSPWLNEAREDTAEPSGNKRLLPCPAAPAP
jgi:hypothetical protein